MLDKLASSGDPQSQIQAIIAERNKISIVDRNTELDGFGALDTH